MLYFMFNKLSICSMKKLIVVLILIFAFSCKSKMSKNTSNSSKSSTERFQIVKVEEVDSQKKEKSYNLGKRLLEACNTSKFKPFTTDEATEKVITNATSEKITATCKKINLRNGKFIELDLIEVTLDKDADEYIFRYDIKYEKTYFKRELMVTLNAEEKVSAISTKESYKAL